MKSLIKTILLSGCLLFSSLALSEQSSLDSNPWRASILLGSSDVQLTDSNISSQSLMTPGFEVGYQFNQQVGLKFGSQTGVNFGAIPSAILGGLFGIEIEDYSYDTYYFAATAQTDGEFHLFGSLGVARINEVITVTNSSLDFKSNSTQPYWELGIGWNVSENFGVGLSYSDTNAELAEISTLQFKLNFEF